MIGYRMNTEWQVKPRSKKSAVSGEAFVDGDVIHCFVYMGLESGELERVDILEGERDHFEVPGNLLAQWSRVVRNRDEEEKEVQRQVLQSAEECFISFFDESLEVGGSEQTRNMLKQVLGLMLERKRVLRRLKDGDSDVIRYLHVASKREYVLLKLALGMEDVVKIQEQLAQIIH